jgi:hypothetical protein
MKTDYTDCISLTQALYFDLFDDIKYKWLKLILNSRIDLDEYDFQVHIEDLPCDRPAFCKVKFTFDLQMEDDERWGRLYYKTKTFTKIIEYNGSSELAATLCGMIVTSDDDESCYDENEDEESEEEEPTSVIDLDVASLYPVVEIR